MIKPSLSALLCGSAAAVLLAAASAHAQQAPLIQPGAPGQDSRTLEGRDAARVADNRYSADDVRFMQDMIHHHGQALEMSALVRGRTNTPELIQLAARIEASQADEITFMQDWLRERGEDAPAPAPTMGDDHSGHHGDHHGGHHGGHHGMGHSAHAGMPGMATPAQMRALEAARGEAFDQMFLELMIRHHEGALQMVTELFARPGSAFDPVLYRFATDVSNEQQAEINRMAAMLRARSSDPRVNLRPGFRDAGEAIYNMELLASLPKPTGFYDPSNPEGLPMRVPAPSEDGDARRGTADLTSRRAPFLSFANTDMAFSGDLLAVGNYHGVQLYRMGDGPAPELISAIVCPGGQGDVSIAGNLLLMSVESPSARVDCGREGVGPDPSPERFRGLRIFDISDLSRPRQVGQVQTCRGSHTHTIVDANDQRLIVYNSGISSVRAEEELAGCVVGQPGETRTALFRVDVIEIPLADPSRARIIDSPAVFADGDQLAGLWRGGDHGDGTQTTNRTDHCHDITIFPSLNLAAGACSGNGILFDISNPRQPRRIDAVVDPAFAYWHSATFNNDGTKVIFTDEWGGGGRPRCRVQDPQTWGANAIYDIVEGRLVFRSYYKLPAPQTDLENCVAHNGSLVPVPGRDLFVQAWYQGGISISDFTDTANPVEIAYFDRGPLNAERMTMAGYWSVYWYNGLIYGTEIARGLDVFALTPSAYLSENEIAAARMANLGETVNPQQQFEVTWPAHPVVARAYMDQLGRDNALSEASAAGLTATLERATALVDGGGRDAGVARDLRTQAGQLPRAEGMSGRRLDALRDTLTRIADRIG
ncbi:MAG: DUF305 domain-containing protein [Brevundimonas sp.]|uniref:DUF305 domain-containing protein n=1 Tax=Brevundimonas sp. TaxID=1871086 RepID=UPI00391B4556